MVADPDDELESSSLLVYTTPYRRDEERLDPDRDLRDLDLRGLDLDLRGFDLDLRGLGLLGDRPRRLRVEARFFPRDEDLRGIFFGQFSRTGAPGCRWPDPVHCQEKGY